MKKELALKIFVRSFQWLIIIIVWALYIAILLSILLVPFALIIVPLLWIVVLIIVKLQHLRFVSVAHNNVIIHGGRGKGKGLLFNMAVAYEQSFLTNIEYGSHGTKVSPKEYFGSIAPNTALLFLQGHTKKVKKQQEWERKPYYFDDGAIYVPNYNDNEVKKIFPSMTLFIPIQRHLYDTYTVINAQSIERLFKPLRELQDDGYIKALKTIGKGYIWQRLPILRKYFITRYRFHENLDSALNNRLPFSALGIVNNVTSTLVTTTPEAMRKQYEATNGKIFDGFIVTKKTNIKYDTRYFAKEFFTDDDKQITPIENETKGL